MAKRLLGRRGGLLLAGNPYFQRVLSVARDNLLAYYPLSELSGTNVVNLAAALGLPAARGNGVVNGGFGVDASGWTAVNQSILDSIAGGQDGNCLEVKNGPQANGGASQKVRTRPGHIYTLPFYHKNGTAHGLLRIGTALGLSDIYASSTLNDLDWTLRIISFTAPTTSAFIRLVNSHGSAGETTLFDSITCTGPLPDAVSVGVDVGQPGIGDGRTSMYFDGVNDYVNAHSPALNGAFNGDEGTALVHIRAASWPGGNRRFLRISDAAAANYINLQSGDGANSSRLTGAHNGGGTITYTAAYVTGGHLNWIPVTITWSRSADQVLLYCYGQSAGAAGMGLGAWGGTLSASHTVIGAVNATPSQAWHGNIQHVALFNRALSPAEIAYVSRVR